MSIKEILTKRLNLGNKTRKEMSFEDVKKRFALKDNGKPSDIVTQRLEKDF